MLTSIKSKKELLNLENQSVFTDILVNTKRPTLSIESGSGITLNGSILS